MRIAISAVVAAIFAVSAPVAWAQIPPPASTPAPAGAEEPTEVSPAVVEAPKPDPDPEICRRETPTGSRIAVKVCKKKSQWVAVSKRSSGVSGTAYADGFDDKAAPLPPSNE